MQEQQLNEAVGNIVSSIEEIDAAITYIERRKLFAMSRLARYHELVNRKQYNKLSHEKKMRNNRRIQSAMMLIDNAPDAIEELTAARNNLQKKLESSSK
jgi:cell division protein ZapA (FtsZ GTPase activity inhibitor)